MPLPTIMKIFQTIKKLWSAQEFGLEIRSWEIIKKRTEQELSFLHATILHDLIIAPTIYYQIISNSMGLMACTRFWLRGRLLLNEERENCLSSTQHAYWSSSTFLPNIIKLSQTVWSYGLHKISTSGEKTA